MNTSAPLSVQPTFANAIVVCAEWMNIAGSGQCELALVLKRTRVELWHWSDDGGRGEQVDLGPTTSWRDAVEKLATAEEFQSPIEPRVVVVNGSPRFVGHLLALAWCDKDEAHQTARVLSKFSDAVLSVLDKSREGILDRDIQEAVASPLRRLREASLEFDELPNELDTVEATPSGIRAALDVVVNELARKEEIENQRWQERTLRLAVWQPALRELERRWKLTHPARHAGGIGFPPTGWLQLRAFVEDHLLSANSLPVGIHEIRSTPDSMAGRVALLSVDFDILLADWPKQLSTGPG